MLYKITACEIKGADWKIISAVGLDNTVLENCSVNRVGKPKPPEFPNGQIFPNFDDIIEGGQVTGEPWTSAQGKQYLFPPRPVKPQGGASGAKSATIAAAQTTKRKDIEEAQERKASSIALQSAMRDATQITLAALKETPFPTDAEFQEEWKKWVSWLLKQNSELSDIPF